MFISLMPVLFLFSQKKLKSKEERKLKRKQHKQSVQAKRGIGDEILQQKEDSASHSQQKGKTSRTILVQ